MSESLMGGRSGDRTESWRMLADLQSRVNARNAEECDPAGTAKGMLDDLQHRVGEREQGDVAASGADEGVAARDKAELFGYLLGLEIGRTFGEEEVDEGTALRVSEDVLREIQDGTSHSIPRDELDKLNGRVVRRGEQPGKA